MSVWCEQNVFQQALELVYAHSLTTCWTEQGLVCTSYLDSMFVPRVVLSDAQAGQRLEMFSLRAMSCLGGSVMERVRGPEREQGPSRLRGGSGNVRGPSLSCRHESHGLNC